MMKHIYTKLTFLLLLLLGSTSLFAGSDYYSKRTAKVANTGLGKVYVSVNDDQNSSTGQGTETATCSTKKNASSAPSYTYTFTAEPNDGYYCTGWYTKATGGSSKSSNNPYSETGVTANTTESNASATYYARFAAITVNAADAASVNIYRAGTYTADLYFTVSNGADAKADFYDPTITANTGWSVKEWSLDATNHKVKVTCSFKATSSTAKKTHTATVTVKSKANKYNTGTVSAVVDLTPTLTYNDGSVDISVSDADKTTLNLSTLKTAYQGKDNQAGDGTITYALKTTDSNVSLTSAGVFYAKATGTYTIVASATAKSYYAASKEFTVTVGKRTPTIVWKEYEHIYSGNTLTNPASLTYKGNSVENVGITYTSGNTSVMTVDNDRHELYAQSLQTAQEVVITATTESTPYYESVNTPTKTYHVEAKQTPVFTLNGKTLVAQDTTIRLKIGEKVNMTFEKIDESNNQFTYPTTSGAATYAHSSSNHTGVITAEYFGNRTIVFEQKGTTTIFGQKHNVTVYVDKHPVTLATTTAFNNKTTWRVDDVFEGDIYTVTPTPANGQPAQNSVTVTSSNEQVLKFVDNKWKAVAEGDAKLTIAQKYNDFWTGDTITTANIHVSKHTPTITWNNDLNSQRPWGAVINNPVSSTNTDIPFTLESSNKNIADYVDGKIEVYNVSGSVTFTLTQAGNDKWNAANANTTKTFTVYKPNNHVEFTISNSNHTTFDKNQFSSNASWYKSSYYRLGYFYLLEADANRDDYFILEFTGIPDKIQFDKQLESINAGFKEYFPETRNCYVYESPNGTDGSWEQVWYDNSDSPNPLTNIVSQLNPSTRFVKFRYYGTIYCQYKNIKITERKEIVAPEEHDFLSGGIGDNPTTHTIGIEWYNVKTCTVTIEGTDAKYFQLGDDSKTIASHVDAYSETDKITVRYLHEEIKEHTATLRITSADGKEATVTLKGKTTKAAQEITWNPNYIVDGKLLIAKDALYTDIATASSGGDVQLSELNNTLLTIDGNSITGHIDGTEGTTKLTAYQAGNANKWAEATATIDVVITSKTVQNIVWNDELSNFKYTGTPIDSTLTAFSSADRNLQITYELDENAQAFATLNGNKLTINGTGSGTITAKQVGNNTYVAVTASKTITSYNPNSACAQSNLTLTSTSFKLSKGDEKTIDVSGGEAEQLTFTAKVGGTILNVDYYDGEWHNICSLTEASSKSYGPYNLSRNTTQIKFQATYEVFASGQHSISNIKVTKARYLEAPDAENNLDFSAVQLGQTIKRQFAVNYSDASGVFEVKLANASEQFELQSYTLGSGCGDTKENAIIKINCTGKNKGKEENAIIISNKTNSITIPITATVTGLTQQIHWNLGESEEITTTDNITISATADSELPVTFSSSDNSIAEVKNENGVYVLDIKQGNKEVTITATQAGNETWEPTSKSCKFVISKVKPEVTKYPTAQEVTLSATLADCAINTDFTASVPGSFAWKTPTTDIERFNTGYTAVFTPTNSGWYDTVQCTIKVPVAKITQQINWTVDNLEIYCNANLTFHVTATGKTAVYFESSKAQIAYIDDDQVLRISQGGKVTLTAKTDGDATYAAAQKAYEFTILRVSPEIVTYPTADTMKVGGLLSDATIRGGLVKLGNATVEGSFSWVDGNTTAMDVAGKFQKEILFTPTEAGWYEPVTGKKLEVVVEKYAPIISQMGLTAANITYGDVLSGATGLSGSIDATDTVKKPNIPVYGTYEWVSKAELYDVHTATATAVFKPTNNAWYNDVEFEVPITVLPKQLTTCTATAELAFGQKLSEAVFTNTTTGLSGEDVDGNITWNENVNTNVILAMQDDPYEFDINFESLSDNYADGYGKCYVTIIPGVVFNGEGGNTTWSNDDNWLGGDKPESTDRVVVDANVDITGNITIGGLTINAGNTVSIKDGSTLTIGEQSSLYREAGYGNIIVEAGGQLNLGSGDVQVNDFTLYSGYDEGLPKSGQVSNPTKIHANGNAYFILDLDPAGEASYGWYDFTVPFPVNVMTGVARSADGINWDTNIQNEKNYAVMAFYEELRAQDQYAWKKFRGILEPGRAYTMTIDSKINTYRFAMTQEGTFNTTMTQTLEASAEGEENGWNGVGNGTMQYIKLSEQPVVQMYQHTSNVYLPVDAGSQAFAVGSAYFVQKSEQLSQLTLVPVQDATSVLRAPQREREADERFGVTLTQDGKTCDNLFVTCSDEATTAYTRGKDVQKMGYIEGAKIARLWTNAKGKNLCAIYTACTGNETVIPMNIYAPAAGAYNIALTSLPEEDIYLTRNGVIVWDLTMSDYTLDLNAGTDNTYALMVVRRINNTATGVDATDNDKRGTDFVEKIIVNDQLFILRDGIMYDAQGKRVTEKY